MSLPGMFVTNNLRCVKPQKNGDLIISYFNSYLALLSVSEFIKIDDELTIELLWIFGGIILIGHNRGTQKPVPLSY
jgi:hypothetical protein